MRDTTTAPDSAAPEAPRPGERRDDARRRIRVARAAAHAAMENRREAVRADFERRVRELDDDGSTTDRPTAA